MEDYEGKRFEGGTFTVMPKENRLVHASQLRRSYRTGALAVQIHVGVTLRVNAHHEGPLVKAGESWVLKLPHRSRMQAQAVRYRINKV
jgi:hypothetical protein